MEKEFDEQVLMALINLYNDINGQIESFGEEVIAEHSPGILPRRDKIKDYIVNYAQVYIKGLAFAENMRVSDIETYLTSRNHTK